MAALFRTGYAACLVAAVATLVGCGAESGEAVTVSGKVTVDGRPADGVVLSFYAPSASAAAVTTESKEDGTYSATFTPPAPDAEYRVTAAKLVTKAGAKTKAQVPAEGMDATQLQMMGLATNVLPKQYESKGMSGLTAQLKPGTNEKDFALRSK